MQYISRNLVRYGLRGVWFIRLQLCLLVTSAAPRLNQRRQQASFCSARPEFITGIELKKGPILILAFSGVQNTTTNAG
jgi:hypothetical protein